MQLMNLQRLWHTGETRRRGLVLNLGAVAVLGITLQFAWANYIAPDHECRQIQEQINLDGPYQLIPHRAASAAIEHCAHHGNRPKVHFSRHVDGTKAPILAGG